MQFTFYHKFVNVKIKLLKLGLLLTLWLTPLPILFGQTLYSYQSGTWTAAATWTTDPSGTIWVNPAASIPTNSTAVVILNGRIVSTAGNNRQTLALEIREGGVMDVANNTGHNFGTVTGRGTLRLTSNTFPGGTFTSFVAALGGTVEYYNYSGNMPTQAIYNNLKFSNNTASANNILLTNPANPSPYTINGDLTLVNNGSGSLTFTLGNAATNVINLNQQGNLNVGNGCNIRVGNFNAIHNIDIYGSFVNNGSVRFTNQASPVQNSYYTAGATTTGAAVVTFRGATNNSLTCNGITDFYRFVINKGTDQTYLLDVTSSNVANFAIYAANDQGGNNFAPPNPNKALFIANGTLKLNDNINIPSLTEGGQDFNIIPTAALWVNGATVSTTVSGINGTGYQAATLKGKLRISSGSFTTSDAAGIVLDSVATPEIIVEGTGTLDASQVWGMTGGANKISFTQSGGTVNLRLQGENHGGYMLNLTNANAVFTMSGGVLNFLNNTYINGTYCTQIFNIQSAVGNYKVTGGAVNLNMPYVASHSTYDINSRVPFYNLNVLRQSGASQITIRSASALNVLNDLTLNANTILDAATNTVNVNIGNNFIMDAASVYNCGNNTTVFNGNGGQRFTNAGVINGGTGLYNLMISGTSNTDIYSQDIIVRGNLTINANCFLNDFGNNIGVAGNIINSGAHTSQSNGGIVLNSSGAQTIGGSGSGVFGQLIINKTSGTASLIADQTLTGNLRLANGLLDIKAYKLTLGANSNVYDDLTGIGTGFSATKMICSAGNQSDGGVTKTYKNTTAFIFPVGTASDYTPGTIQFTLVPTTYGSVNLKPVARYQPYATSGNVLNYYWKVTSAGFTGIKPGSIRHTYHYVDADWLSRGDITSYIPGVYNPNSWVNINDIAQVVDATNDIYFTNVNYLNGDFTAGQLDAFNSVLTYYSRSSGNWNDGNTWSTDTLLKWNGPAAGSFPGASNPVIIGDGASRNHTITVIANGVQAGSLQISNKSVLDLGVTINHNFGSLPDPKAAGFGKLRISSANVNAAFPAGDFGRFLAVNGGTVEYYSSGAVNFTLPKVSNYNNLIISPASGRAITMPDTSVLIFNNFRTQGAGMSQLNAASAQTLTVKDSIIVFSGTLRFMNNNTSQILNANGDVVIFNGAVFDVTTASNGSNKLYIQGNLTNNGTFDMYAGAATRICDVYFTGNTNKLLSGNSTLTEFNYLAVDKGNSRNTILDVTINNLNFSGSGTALVLNNGTFRVSNPALNFTLSTNTAFTIPATGCLSVDLGTVNIGTTSNAGDLNLAGRLEVINNGNVNIGNGGNFNNDIEYAAAGSPEIIVKGGNLVVNGQIRRNAINTLGSLIYNQSGGIVTVNGQNQAATMAKFGITNTGSSFTMSGGSLIIVRAGGTTYGDVYINPEAYNITGGTIQLGSVASPAGQVFILNSSSPIWNLTIDGTTNPKTLSLQVRDLKVKNNLSINGNSIFQANGLQVNIGGNFINQNTSNAIGVSNGGYQPGTATQLTMFDGSLGNQTISGVSGNLTNFAKLIVNNTFTPGRITLGANTNLRINSDLTLFKGILNDGGNIITVMGNISNSAVHESPSGNGIVLSGSVRQLISGSGNGQFGNLSLNNTNDVYLVDNTTINSILAFTNGNLYIDDYQLAFGQNASISGAAATKMIILNGVVSDEGVKKNYPASASSFTFPIGVAGKYTPVTINLTANSTAGNVVVKPVNGDHPSLQDVAGNELHYYWTVASSGFGAVTSTQDYSYLSTDVSGTEASYNCGRFLNGDWVPANGIAGTVNSVSHHITLNNVSYIDGEYTAGLPSNFTAVATYYSITSGNWESPGTWSTVSNSGPPASGIPNGNKVVIATKDTVTITTNSSKAYSLVLNGTLELGTTVFHSLGFVTGNGTIRLTSTADGFFVFPGGNFDVYMNNPQSLVIFSGDNTATLPSNIGTVYKPYQNVILKGTGTKNMAYVNMKIQGYLTINGGKLSDADAGKNLYILGKWNDNVASGFVAGTGLVSFSGTAAQQMNLISSEQFYNLEINNALGLTPNNNVNVSNGLFLTSGNINTSGTALLTLTNINPYSVMGGSSSSFINGPMAKAISSGSFFSFPTGKAGRYGVVNVNSASAGIRTWTAEYYNSDPATAGMNPATMQLPVDSVSNNEYWRVNGGAAAIQANARLRWDNQSGIIPADSLTRLYKMRVLEWNGSWQNRGGVVVDGGVLTGTVETPSPIALNNNHYLTIGLERRPTATITNGTTSICNGADANIPVTITGISPWTMRYKINGGNEATISNIGTSPFTIVANYDNLASLGGGPGYVFTISYISDAFGTPGKYDFVTSATVNLLASPSPSINGKTTVSKGENGVMYNVPNLSGHTYTWTVTNGAIVSGQNTNQITVNWSNSASSGSVQVNEVITVTGCLMTDIQNIVISNAPTPLIVGNNSVCFGIVENYRTAPAVDHTFIWTVTGGSVTTGQGTNQISVNWDNPGAGSVTVVERVIATGVSGSNTLNITVHSLPDNSLVVTDTSTTCTEGALVIKVKNGEVNTDYTLRLNSNNSTISTIHNASLGDVAFTVSPVVTTIYNVLAVNQYNCSSVLTDLSNVSLTPPLIAPVQSDQSLMRRP